VDEWKKEHESLEIQGIKKKTTLDKLVYYFVDGGNFIKIYDKRDKDNIRIYVLDEIEREVFLTCTDVISINELQELFPDVTHHKLTKILETFEQNHFIFNEDNHYLSLPLRYKTRLLSETIKEDYVLATD
jgi:hypothetical protein